ncbi:MAG: hypothetical protein ACI9VO_002417 [Colwellia sp.]|jgi:hypothetical protein
MLRLFDIADKLTLKKVLISSLLEKVEYLTKHKFHSIGSVYMDASM